MEFLSDVQPTAVLSFHQPFAVVDITHAPARQAGRLLAKWMDLPARVVRCSGPCQGTLTEWATKHVDAIALTVELSESPTETEISQAAAAIMQLSRWLAGS
jgi:hypothetical protein